MADVTIDIIAKDSFSGVLGNFGSIMTGMESVVNLVREAFEALAGPVIDFGKESALTAARVEELALVDEILANNAGLAAGTVDTLVGSLRDTGIQADVAYETIAQMIRANLDLADATELARVAQDAAVISGMNSSETLDNIIYGITTLNPLVLRHAGIIVDLQLAYQEWAAENGRTVESLTTAEKQQIAMNEVLEAGALITGSYETAMTNAYKQLGSFDRYINDIQLSIGNYLLPAFSDLIFATADWLKYIGKAVEDGGSLAPVLEWIGDRVKIIVDNFASGVGFVTDFFETIIEKSTNIINVLQPGEFGDTFVSVFDPTKFLPNLLSAIDEFVVNFMQSIADSINNWVDTGGGDRLSQGIINWIEKLGDVLSSGTLLETGFAQAAFAIAGALLNALANIDWGGIGSALDEFVGKLFNGMATALDNWVSSGGAQDLTDTLIGWIENIGTGPEFQSTALIAAGHLITALGDAIAAVDWDAIGSTLDHQVAEAIRGIDWSTSGQSLTDSIAGLFSLENLKNSIISGFYAWIDTTFAGILGLLRFLTSETGQATSEALSDFLSNATSGLSGAFRNFIASVVSEIGDVAASIINAIKDYLGISSPSTVFYQIGRDIILGLINGISSLLAGITYVIGNIVAAILGPIQPVLDLLGIDFGGNNTIGTSGTTNFGNEGTSVGVSGSTVNNYYYFYGNAYLSGVGPEGGYECTPSPIITSTTGTLHTQGFAP